MSLDIHLLHGSSRVFTFQDAVHNATDQVLYGYQQPDSEFTIPFGNYNIDGTTPDDVPYRTLYSNGCSQADGTNNCTAACSSADTTFKDMYTLNNCLAYIKISESIATVNMTKHGDLIAKQFGISGDLMTKSLVHNTIYNCLSDLCSTIVFPGRACEVESVCESVSLHVSSEVGGPGVCAQSPILILSVTIADQPRYTSHIGCKPLFRPLAASFSNY